MIANTLPTNPVQSDYSTGNDLVNVRALRMYCDQTNANIQQIVAAVNTMEAQDRIRYDRALQFINWLATTNPKVLDEFKAVERTLQCLEPGDGGGQAETCAAP